MASELSPQNEKFIAQALAAGAFPSKQAALDAAVTAMRENFETAPWVPAEHMALVEAAIASSHAGESREMIAADWEKLRERVRDAALRNNLGAD
jgi:Arc/MetJ-type ribon-helix-helix transcriptional regulator